MPAVKDLEIYQGDDWQLDLRLRSRAADGTLGAYLVLTGSVPKAQVRNTTDDLTVRAEMTAVLGNQTTTPGSVSLALSSVQTTALAGTYAWDFQLTDASGKVTTYLVGAFICDKQVTR